MSLNLDQKKQVVEGVSAVVGNAQATVIAEYRGMTVEQMKILRREAYDNNVYVKVVKNVRWGSDRTTHKHFACRFSMGSSTAGQLKRMVTMVTEHAHNRKQFGRPIAEYGLVQDKVFDMIKRIYAMESMAYMTAYQMDQVNEDGKPKTDCSVEAAMVKVRSI